MKNLLLLIIISTMLVGCVFSPLGGRDSQDLDICSDGICTQEIEGFTFTAQYLDVDGGEWLYTVSTFAPNPCYSIGHEVLIAESFPEQVTITAWLVEPSGEEMCVQVLDEQLVTGTYLADEQASVSFQVK